jgi:N-acetylglutamate synthase-like GNAT family acetyltransferase
MNPLGVKGDRFLVASTNTNPRIGFAQIRPLPNRQRSIEQETDDVMWDEFENDTTIQVPVGLQSLPWTKEYREFAAAATSRRRRTRDAVKQEVQKETPILYELASVWVDPAFRGCGIGTELVRRILQRHVDEMGNPLENVYLLTLATTAHWYTQNFGFQRVPIDYVPTQMTFEVQAGNIITALIGAELVCMQGDTKLFQTLLDKKDKNEQLTL